MASNMNVKFFFTDDINKYKNLAVKDPLALYFVEDPTNGFYALYKGENLIGTGSVATTLAAGLMSSADKIALDTLVASGGGISNLVPVDGSISIVDGEDGKKNIGVAISSQEGNALQKKDDGLFVVLAQEVEVPEYVIEKQAVAEEGFTSTYKLKRTVNGVDTYVGDAINFAVDAVLESVEFKTVIEVDVPYAGAAIGDRYIDFGFNTEDKQHIYVPVEDLGVEYVAGDGIQIVDDTISVKIADDSHGLTTVNGEITMLLATSEQDGAMSKEDKAQLNEIVALDIPNTFVSKIELDSAVKSAVSETVGTPNAEQFHIDENGVLTLTSIDAEKVIYNGQKLSDILDEMDNSYAWEELPETVSLNLSDEGVSAASVIADANEGTIVQMSAGTVNEVVTVDKSVTIEGENAGIAQNFSQEV